MNLTALLAAVRSLWQKPPRQPVSYSAAYWTARAAARGVPLGDWQEWSAVACRRWTGDRQAQAGETRRHLTGDLVPWMQRRW